MEREIVHLQLADLGAEIRLDEVRTLLGKTPSTAPLVTRSPAPASAVFASPLEVSLPEAGGTVVEVRLHAVGAVAVRMRMPFAGAPEDMLAEARAQEERWSATIASIVERVKGETGHAMREPYSVRVAPERYTVYCVGADKAAVGLLAEGQASLARLVAGDPLVAQLPHRSASVLRHILQSAPDEAIAIGWDHAVIVGAGPYEDVLDVMELANLELLELRTYDAYLDRRLDSAFSRLDRLWAAGGLFRSARATLRDLSALRLEFARLTDNLNDTGKLFGDWYMAEVHDHLRQRFHLRSWEQAVREKMATLEDMFHLAQEETNHRRSILVEILIVLLFILDLVVLVRVG